MAKSRSLEEDKAALRKKVKERVAKSGNSEGDRGVRLLRKRLKRAQRKLRAHAARISRAGGKKKASPA